MPLVHFTFERARVPEGAVNVQDVTESYRDSMTNPDLRIYTWETHHGLCIEEREHNGRDDSDFEMLIWNPETGQADWVEFYSTRGWCYPCRASRPDATPEVLAQYNELLARRERDRRALHQERLAAMPAKGKTVRVVKGRKVPVGTTGACFWASTRFKTDKVLGVLFLGYEGRVGIETPAGRVFVNAENVEVVS